jgi:DNA-binding response OmpR family regulator
MPRITRPKVLLVVGHPSIGTALETLLRIEGRYAVRRAQSLDQAASGLDDWVPDLAVVDGVLAENGRTEAFTMPTVVLSGNLGDGKRLVARFPAGRGWLRKDATAAELRAGIDQALAQSGSPAGARRLALALVLVVLVILIALSFYWVGMPR